MDIDAKNQKKTDKNILVVSTIFFVVFMAVILCFSIDFGVLYEVSQNPESFYASETVGLSMYPQIYTGDMFIVQTINHSDFIVNIGDILIFDTGHSHVGHRVLEIHEDYYITRGDNNCGYETVYQSRVIGRVYKIIYRTNPIGQYMFNLVAN